MSIFKKVRVLWECFGTTDLTGTPEIQGWVEMARKKAVQCDGSKQRIEALESQVKALQDQVNAMQEVLNIKTETVDAVECGEFMVKGKRRVKVGQKKELEDLVRAGERDRVRIEREFNQQYAGWQNGTGWGGIFP